MGSWSRLRIRHSISRWRLTLFSVACAMGILLAWGCRNISTTHRRTFTTHERLSTAWTKRTPFRVLPTSFPMRSCTTQAVLFDDATGVSAMTVLYVIVSFAIGAIAGWVMHGQMTKAIEASPEPPTKIGKNDKT